MTSPEEPVRCDCGRRLLVVANGSLCVRCMKPSGQCTCRSLVTRSDGWGEAAYFPRGKYKVEEDDDGWSVLILDDGSFS